jgi:hypothetical protein
MFPRSSPRKRVLCMIVGLTRTYQKSYSNFISHLIKHNEKNYEFTFLLNTQDLDKAKIDSLIKHYSLPRHHLKGIMQLNCNSHSKNATYLRLSQCLKSEQNNVYDIYINTRFDNILTAPIHLDHYTDKLCIITGNWERSCFFHNRDWDLMSVGNRSNYLLYHYPLINHYLSIENIGDLLPNLLQVKDITDEEITYLDKLCGLITDTPNKDYSLILKNMISLKGTFCMSENLDRVHVILLR